MSEKTVSEQELRERLADQMSEEDIQRLIDEYVDAASQTLPDMETLKNIAVRKPRGSAHLQVRFGLTHEQYEALTGYYEEPEEVSTVLVKKVLEEFMREKGL